jgi:hypothetical protein
MKQSNYIRYSLCKIGFIHIFVNLLINEIVVENYACLLCQGMYAKDIITFNEFLIEICKWNRPSVEISIKYPKSLNYGQTMLLRKYDLLMLQKDIYVNSTL